MINTKLNKILTFLSNRVKTGEEYTPKFVNGDIIINKYTKNGQSMDLILSCDWYYQKRGRFGLSLRAL